jgi:general secretion pathway protein K
VDRETFFGTPEAPGWEGFLTVFGMEDTGGGGFRFPGRVNLGTAPVEVIRALLPAGMEEVAQEIADYRTERSGEGYLHDITSTSWYTDVPGFSFLTGEDRSRFEDRVTTSSDVFSVDATAELAGRRHRVRAVVQRVQRKASGQWTCRVLQWRVMEPAAEPVEEMAAG